MEPLHFDGKADAYLEWAAASNFAWVSQTKPGHVDVLCDDGSRIDVRSAARSALPGASRWSELAQAVRMTPYDIKDRPHWLEDPPAQVLGMIDSGIGQAWLRTWKAANPSRRRKTFYWDMEPNTPSPPLPRVSHGAHVLSWLAGVPPYPSHAFARDPASQCPLILVNLPQEAVDDPTGRWLGRYILDGLDYMVRQAMAIKARQLVVNISWGPQTGPHDGSSLLERALVQRIAAAQDVGLSVDIVLAAGNSRESRAHAQFGAVTGCQGLAWVVPPASRTPSFLELWWPPGADIDKVHVEVTLPSGQPMELVGQGRVSDHGAHGVVVLHPAWDGGAEQGRPMALLALNPTGHPSQAAAHGRWRITVRGVEGAGGCVHAYVARHAANLGGRYRGSDSHLDDPAYGQQRFRRHHVPQGSAARVTREGTLSGLAGLDDPAVHVATGSVWSTGQPAAYASEGGVAFGGAVRPDWALPCDETPLLKGVLGAGSRPGSVVRLVGTSMAVPQLARLLLNGLPAWPVASPWHCRTGHGLAHTGWTSRQRS